MLDFESRIGQLPASIWSQVSEIDSLRGQWVGGAKLNPQLLGRLKRSVLVTSTGASTRIEGSRLSDEDVEKFMRGLSLQRFADRDTQEVRGYFELLENVFDSWKRIPFTENSIKHLHKELLKYAEKDGRHRGEYKKTENAVEAFDPSGVSVGIIFETAPAYMTPTRMRDLVDWTTDALARKDSRPLVVIGNFVVEFFAIHPFQDGNGRLSRILTNLLLLRAGYEYVPYVSHEKLIEDNKSEYYVALRRSQSTLGTDHENIVPWLEFFLNVILSQTKLAVELLSHENIEKILSIKQLAVWHFLETVDEATPAEIMGATGISRPTLSQALNVLLRLKRIERIGQGRAARYVKSVRKS